MEHIYDGAFIGPDAPLSNTTVKQQKQPSGELHKFDIKSDYLKESRELIVYQPANYNPDIQHNLIIQLDGEKFSRPSKYGSPWQGWTPMPTIIDNLIQQEGISPTIVIMVPNKGDRSKNMLDDKFGDFLALDVIRWARLRFNIGSSDKVIISGPSRAAYAAANTALRYSTIFGGVLSQSGSFYYTKESNENWPIYPEFEGVLLKHIKDKETLPVRFYLDVGLYDLGLGRVGINRQLRDILSLKGYSVSYYEYKGGHGHLNWRHTLARGVKALLGKPTE
ncbi:alpha/beta hydrolase [Pleionea sediminis]|uniref:alpha/beta hydrolase n=1 Tax=Pleionea sediminis TaxID=2569479 RepID=UPI001184D95E|nr:alpha/beta hydrolase-fold protein [Pleionea sediminis]